MKIKNFVASIFTVTTLALIGVSAQAQTVDAATTMANISGVVYVNNTNGAVIYNSPNANDVTESRRLANQTGWVINKSANVDGTIYYQVGTNAWVVASDTSNDAPAVSLDKDMYINVNGGVNVYDAPNGSYTGAVNGGVMTHVYASKTDANGTTWYNLANNGGNRWIKGDFLSEDNVKKTVTMSATAYDPAVLGSNMGYSGVAANLSNYPKGTHLRITDSNGKVYDRVVNDTGYFAYGNPNQLDIAMPNSEALQFGRQNVTVQVLGN